MKIIFRPIFIIFFVFLALSFSFSMKKSSSQNIENQASLQIISAENARLQLKEQELIYQNELASRPFTQEQLYRDQKWLKLEGESNLELNGFKYEPRVLEIPLASPISIWQEWRTLLF